MSRSFTLLIASGAVLIAGLMALTLLGGRKTSFQSSATGPGNLPVLRMVQAFALTNQNGGTVTLDSLKGKPWAANLIFTRCPGPCTQLSGVMRSIQEGLPKDLEARIVSFTSDPEHDVPKVLAGYAAKHGANLERWWFLTGARKDIRRLVVEDLLMVLQDKPEAQRESPEDLFLHSTLIVVVDRAGQVRGVVEGLEPGASQRVIDLLTLLGQVP